LPQRVLVLFFLNLFCTEFHGGHMVHSSRSCLVDNASEMLDF